MNGSFDPSGVDRHGDGRFAERTLSEPSVAIDNPDRSTTDALSCNVDQLWELVNSDEATDQVMAANALDLSEAQADVLAEATQPFPARMAVASRAQPGCAARLAHDPDPVVRARALDAGFDLDDDTRAALAADPRVARVRTVLGLVSA